VAIWGIARWFVALLAVMLLYALVYAFAPNTQPRRLRWITPGAGAGVLIWLIASAGFFFYVSNFGKYGATYGAFAGAVILLLWLYISNIAFLFGAELNAAVDGARRPARGAGPSPSPQPQRSPSQDNGAVSAQVDDKYGRDALAQR
jgi:membrane protein